MENYLKIKLKENWDFPQHYQTSEPSGVFAERINGEDKIKDIFSRKSQSSILVSGPRGRGKTSLIYKIIRDLKGKNIFLVPVIINAAQLEVENLENNNSNSNYNKINCLTVLENLIRRLFISLDDEIKGTNIFFPLKDYKKFWYKLNFKFKLKWFKFKVSGVYKKCLATEWSKLENKERINKVSISTKIFWSTSIISALSLVIYFLAPYIQRFIPYNIIRGEVYFYLSLGLILVFNFSFKLKKSTGELYKFDKNLSNLEHDFRRLFKGKGQKDKLRIIFVVDELDYLSIDEEGEQKNERYRSVVLRLIKLYKNLFHFIPVVFCFIGDDDFYRQLNENEIFSTVFTETFYLAYPRQEELYNFLDNIRHGDEKIPTNDGKWGILKYYLMYKAKGDFKRINKVVKDFIKFENNFIFLNPSVSDISRKITIQSKAYKLLCQIYNNSMFTRISEFEKNDKLFSDLYQIIQEEIWDKNGSEFSYSLDDSRGYQEVLLSVLQSCITKVPQGTADKYILHGNSNCPVESLPDDIYDYLPHEGKLKESEENLRRKIDDYKIKLKLESNYISWIEKNSNIIIQQKFDEFERILPEKVDDKITGKHMDREEAEKIMGEIDSINEALDIKLLELLKIRILELNKSYSEGKIDDVNTNIFALLPEIREKIKQIAHFSLYLPEDFSKQLIILNNDDIQNWNEQITKNGLDFSYKIVNNSFNLDEILVWLKGYEKDSMGLKWFIRNGTPQFLLNEINLNSVDGIIRNHSGQLNTLIYSVNDILSLNFECEVMIDMGGILNFLIDYNEEDENSEKYYMARLDTRKGSDLKLCGSGILLKSSGPASWEYLDKLKDKNFETPNEWLKIGVSFKNKNIKFYKYTITKKRTLKKSIIENINIKEKINGSFGFFNERGKCKIKNIKIS